MKAIRMKNGALTLCDAPRPAAGPGEVLVRVESAALTTGAEGRIPGACFAGIVETAPADSGFHPGDRVVCDGRIPCGQCYSCRRQQPERCGRVTTLGQDADGGLAQFAALDARGVYPLPENLSFDAGACALLAADAFAALSRVGHKLGYRLLLSAEGAFGGMLVQLARHAGAGDLLLLSGDARCRTLANDLGIAVAVPSETAEETAAALRPRYPDGITVVIEATGDNALARQLMDLICPSGLLILAGKTTSQALDGLVFDDAKDFFFHICSVAASAPKAGHFQQGLDALACGQADPASLIASVLSLDAAADAPLSPASGLGLMLVHPNE